MPILKIQIQQGMAHQRICQTLGKPQDLNLFSHEQYHNMIINNIKIFSQNIWKNNLIVNTVLKVNSNFNIIFIQESS